MQSAVGELLAALCPADAEVEIFNEKEADIPLERHWDLVFFSYLHAYYEHTKVLSAMFRARGMVTVAGGRGLRQVVRLGDRGRAGEQRPRAHRRLPEK